MIARVWLDTRTRGKPCWCIIYQDWAGHRHRERTQAQSRKEAKDLLTAKLSEVAQVKAKGGPAIETTFQDFVEDEYLPYAKAVCTPRTYETKLNRANTLYPMFGKMRLREITPRVLKQFIADRRTVTSERTKRPLRPATINREIMLLSAVFREAFERELVDANPCRRVKMLPEHNMKDRFLDDGKHGVDEEKNLIAACPIYLRPVVIVGLHTGMRLGELLKLKWCDVSFTPIKDKAGNVQAPGQVSVRAENAKSHQSRHIPMSATLYATLDSMRRQGRADVEAPDMRWLVDKPVFINPKTEKAFRDLGKSFETACVKAGIEGVTFHTLRHTYASRLVMGGVDLYTVSKRLGHGDVKTTARYAHLALDHHDPKESAALDNPGAKVEPVTVKRQRKAAR